MKQFIIILLSVLAIPSFAYEHEWENPTILDRGKEQPHANFTLAREMSLNGLWRFRYDSDISKAPEDFWRTDYDDQSWKPIPVPSNWELQGYGTPIFINFKYNWTPNPPYIDIPNPVGSYRTTFTVPERWKDDVLMLHFGSITGYARIFVNGHEVGMTKCSKTAAEFNVSRYVHTGSNQLAVQVYRYHDGSYMEDQDFWRITGIERSVTLKAYHPSTVWDYNFKATPVNHYRDGRLEGEVIIRNFIVDNKLISNLGILSKFVAVRLINAAGKEVYREDKPVPKNRDYCSLKFGSVLSNVRLWSAEKPNLYQLQIIYAGDTIRQNIGFREVKIHDGRLLVNGAVVYIKGVNRHETNDSLGHVQTREIMMHDLKALKRLNINAVRCCHYPNDPLWYDLCDRYGIYLIDEANIETHGMGSVPYFNDTTRHPAYLPEWVPAHVDRIHRMYYGDRNHPSIIGWSLGNECGNGKVFHDQYRWLKEQDSTRFVQFEQAWEDGNTDVVALMYPNWGRIVGYAKSGKKRPFIMCEYAHAQGNGTGNFQDFWTLIKQSPNLQGGFVWDFQDQGFKRQINENDDHRTYYMYNGGMGSYVWPDDENSGTDGIMASDGTPKPGAWEVKKVYQNIVFSQFDWNKRLLTLRNEYNFTRLDEFSFRWVLSLNGDSVQGGTFSLKTHPGDSTQVRLPIQMRGRGEYTLQVYAHQLAAHPLIPKGYEIAKEQFVHGAEGACGVQGNAPATRFTFHEEGNDVVATADSIEARISKKDGMLWHYGIHGLNVLKTAPEPYFWRAPNDNDFGNRMPERLGLWRQAHVNRWVKDCRVEGNKVVIGYELSDLAVRYTLTYTLCDDASIIVSCEMNTTGKKNLPEMPRFGMRFTLPGHFEEVGYYGRGPIENYPDRKTSQFIGRYRSTVTDLYYPYIRPQQNGLHTDTRWLELSSEKVGASVRVEAVGAPFDFSALHYADEDFDPGLTRKMQHTKDLLERHDTYVILDNVMRGLGGDNSWGEYPHKEYRHYGGDYKFSYRISLKKTR